jgi:hypothetical protein
MIGAQPEVISDEKLAVGNWAKLSTDSRAKTAIMVAFQFKAVRFRFPFTKGGDSLGRIKSKTEPILVSVEF